MEILLHHLIDLVTLYNLHSIQIRFNTDSFAVKWRESILGQFRSTFSGPKNHKYFSHSNEKEHIIERERERERERHIKRRRNGDGGMERKKWRMERRLASK